MTSPTSPPAGRGTMPLRLLIVEDEALIADELEHRLQALNHVVVGVCDTADAAVALAGRERPDLVLMDIRLKGGGDGIEAAERIYARFGLPVVYLTAHSDEATFARARAGAGLFGYLVKPVQERELMIAIDVALQRSRRNAQLYENVLNCDAVLRELADGVVVADEHGRVRAMNRAAELLAGWPIDTARGLPLQQVLRLVDAEGAACSAALAARLEAGERVEIKDAQLPREDGTLRSMWVTATPVPGRDARSAGVVVVLRDVTERKAAIDAERASVAKTEFLSRMSHELRTPLNAMLGFTELLLSDLDDRLSSRQRERMDLVLGAAHHLRALIDDVLDVSLIETGRLPVSLGPVELAPLLDSALELCADLARRHGVQLQARYRDPAPASAAVTVRADPVRLRQSLVNVLTNAVKYNRRGGAVRVSIRHDEARHVVEIDDDGLGMTAEQLGHLFEPFNRLGRQFGPVEGHGLGLSLTRQLLQRMDAEIRVRSREGEGTCVSLWLTPGTHAAPPVVPPPATAGELAGSILYIEDNPVNTLLVEQFLKRWPALRVDSAPDGETGLARAAALQPDLILLDMHLPDMDGVELLGRLRGSTLTRGLRVVAPSASSRSTASQFSTFS